MTKMLDNLDNYTSAGISDIPAKVLKTVSPLIVPFLVDLFNDCLKHCIILAEFKLSFVTPFYKSKGSFEDLINFRGIFILAIIAKIFEKFNSNSVEMFRQMVLFHALTIICNASFASGIVNSP